MTSDSPPDVDALYVGVTRLFDLTDRFGRRAGDCTRGVYLFIDYDGEPIYVGQTTEKLRTRIRRHLTNQRTDAVAMRVLDPFEVAEVEMWPFWDLEGRDVGGHTGPRRVHRLHPGAEQVEVLRCAQRG